MAQKTSSEPSEKTSLAPVTPRLSLACSGDMYAGVPTATLVMVSRVLETPAAIPKSITRGPSSTTRTLDGLRSRWTSPAAWMDCSASAMPATSHRTAPTGSGPQSLTRSSREGAGTYAVASQGTRASASASTTAAV